MHAMLRGVSTGKLQNLRRDLERYQDEIVFLRARLAVAEAGAEELDLLGIAPDAIDGTVGMSLISMTPVTQQRLRAGLDSLVAKGEELRDEPATASAARATRVRR